MGNKTRFLTFVGFYDNGSMTFITDEDGTAEPGRKAWTFTKSEAKDMVNALLDSGVKSAIYVSASRETAKRMYNPEVELAFPESVIKTLVRYGFKKWVRGGKYRLYYGDGVRIAYIDCLSGKIHGKYAKDVDDIRDVLAYVMSENHDDNSEGNAII